MKKRKVITWMKYLNGKELAEFGKTLNGNEKKLFNFLKKYAPSYEHDDLATDDKALKATFGPQAENTKDVANKASDLKLLLEAFFYTKALKNHPFEKKRLLTLELKRRQQTTAAIELLKKAHQKTPTISSPWNSIDSTRIAYDLYFDPSYKKFEPEAKLVLAECKQELNSGYQTLATILAIEQKFRQLILGESAAENLNQEAPTPLLSLLLKVQNLFDPDKSQDFQVVKEQLMSCVLLKTEHDIITTYLLNYTLLQVQKQEENLPWKEKAFDLYKYGIEKGALLQNGQLAENHFVTAIMLACMLGETDWGEQLADKGATLLASSNKDFHLNLAYARLDFAKEEFLAVHERLCNETYANIADNIKVRTLLAKTYFELSLPFKDAIVDPQDCLESLRMYLIRNNAMLKENKTRYNNFIKFTKKLLQAKFHTDKLPELLSTIQNTPGEALDNKEWLLEKAAQLQNNK